MKTARIQTPIGPLTVQTDEKGLVALSLPDSESTTGKASKHPAGADGFQELESSLEAFLRNGKPLPRVQLGNRAGTVFQHKVWNAILKIPFGETRSYGEIAESIGHPGAARAVGSACGANPVPLFVPCHRVLAARGQIGGYGFSGIELKKKLLRLEGHDW